MAYAITKPDQKNYILLKITGVSDRASTIKQIVEAHEFGNELGIRHYLVDVTESQNGRSVMEDYALAYEDLGEDPRINRFAIVAVLVSPDDHSFDFFEVASKNAGWLLQLFRDEGDAVGYLSK